MAFRTDDPIADFHRHDDEQERKLKHLPRCECCRRFIQQDDVVRIGAKYYCDECLEDMREAYGL